MYEDGQGSLKGALNYALNKTHPKIYTSSRTACGRTAYLGVLPVADDSLDVLHALGVLRIGLARQLLVRRLAAVVKNNL